MTLTSAGGADAAKRKGGAAMALGLARALLDLLFPPRCVACGAAGADLCAACLGKIRRPPDPRCARCDTPLDGGRVALGGLCRECAAGLRTPALDRMIVAAVYEGPARSAIHALKYQGKRRVAVPLASLTLAAWRAAGLSAGVIIPVSLYPSRIRQRGYNQSELLARELARATSLPVRSDLLIRVRPTSSQSRLSWSERQRNVADAFALRPGASHALAGRSVLLLDDVMTSGATVQAAASALREARPAAIYAIAVARPLRTSDGEPRGEP